MPSVLFPPPSSATWHFGEVSRKSLGTSWRPLQSSPNITGVWNRDEGVVVLKAFAGGLEGPGFGYTRSRRIHDQIGDLPVFPKVLGYGSMENLPTIAYQALLPPRWADLRGEGIRILAGMDQSFREATALGIVSRLGLLHALGFVYRYATASDEVLVNLETPGNVRLYDAEAFVPREGGLVTESDPEALGAGLILQRLRGEKALPPVPMYTRTQEGRFEIPGRGRYIVVLGDNGAHRAFSLAEDHLVEWIDYSAEEHEWVRTRIEREQRSGRFHTTSLLMTKARWQDERRKADYVEAFFPVNTLEQSWRGADGRYDPARFLYEGLLNKLRPGGIAFVVTEKSDRIREWLTVVTDDPRLESLDVQFLVPPPIAGGYAASTWASWTELTQCSYLVIRNLSFNDRHR